MNDFEETQKLIRLKRFEQPPEEYFDGFLEEFHQRQRAELMKRSSRSLFFERLGTYLSGFGSSRLMFAGGAVAAIALAVLVTGKPPSQPGQTAESNTPASSFDKPQGKAMPVTVEVETGSMAAPEKPPPVNVETQTFEL